MRITANYFTGSSDVRGEFLDSSGRQRNGWEAIFPIVQKLSETQWRPVATGFFISNNGLFATAKHVVVANDGSHLHELYGLHLSRDLSSAHLRQIIKLDPHPKADAAIGFLYDEQFATKNVQTLNPLFKLSTQLPHPGDRIVSYAYPNSIATEHEHGGGTMTLSGNAMEGLFEEAHLSGRDKVLLPGPCLRTNMKLASGASGGPVAFGDGGVFAINSTGFDGTDVSYLTPTSELLDLAVRHVRLLDGSIRDAVPLRELVRLGLVQLVTDDRPETGG
jgi:hypothetical protein